MTDRKFGWAMFAMGAMFGALCTGSYAQLAPDRHSSVVLLKAPGKCTGTGFFVSKDVIVTASHVAQTVRLEAWIGGKRYYATVQKRNADVDYCELRIAGYQCPRPLKTGAPPAIGETVYSYGYPGDGTQLQSSYGQVGFKCGMWYFGGEAPEGMSGGPVVNSRGCVVGIVTNQHFNGGTLFRKGKP